MAAQLPAEQPRRLYDATAVEPAYQLRYSWTGWPSNEKFEQIPTELFHDLCPLWETDGLRLLEYKWTDRQIQLLFSATPWVSPKFLASRAKGRLDHAIRKANLNMPLSRKLGLRSIGNNVTGDIESYIENQVGSAQFVDERFESLMKAFTVVADVDFSRPAATKRGRYWYNLHMVLVAAERSSVVDEKRLATIRDWTLAVAAKDGHLVSRLSVMPDHLHAALRCNYGTSPNAIVNSFQNNLAFAVGNERIWQDNYYVGTFGEYNMRAIRRRRDATSPDRVKAAP